MTRRLILLNGMPGIGKSTIARRYAADHPGTLVCDVDLLRTLVSGWENDFPGAGALIRPAALGFIGGYLAESGDVVLPQLLSRIFELERFERVALAAGAGFVEVMLIDETYDADRRLRARAAGSQGWANPVLHVSEDALAGYRAGLAQVLRARPATRLVSSIGGDLEATYAALCRGLAE